ncbi:radical SAM/SPASM domain-containing protein [Microbacterium sp.]|uniref:radical SAM/SPASM domain-containing protein n=1 Tax=Microbacterium sp. TaxID=51671 RepID=UPI002733F783|nr:radical SAM protein [Microbacterium sp.]MDP3952644.1 radical SAM protein [Microbacterium sp.]
MNLWHPIQRRLDEPVPDLVRFPRYFEIETVNACNARCPMCTIDDWDRRDGLMDAALFTKIADEIGAHADEVRRVHLYRDGEPLIDKRLATKVAELKGRGVKRVGISTNASLLTETRAEGLLLAGIDEVLLSVDSLDRSVYESIRVGLEFEEVMANCLRFIELRDAMASDCQVWVRMIRQESNKNEWPAYRDFWRERLRPTDRVDYRNLHNWGAQLVNFRPIAPADTAAPCVALWSLMVIFASGDVPMCNVDYNNKHPLGNVRDSRIADLWRSQTQNARREAHLFGKREGICVGCTVWDEGANGTEEERKKAA